MMNRHIVSYMSVALDGFRYQLRNGAILSHFRYMDDIKLYAKSEWDIGSVMVLGVTQCFVFDL